MSIHAWEAICFVIFVGLIFKPTKAFFKNYIYEYSNTITRDINDSNNVRVEAQENLELYKQKHKALSGLIKEIDENTKTTIKKLEDNFQKDAETRINTKIQIHKEMMSILNKEQISRLKNETIVKALWISKQYLKDHEVPAKNELRSLLEAAKNKITTIH